MKVNPIVFGVTVVVVFLAVILGFQGAGVWSISGKVDSAGKAIQPVSGDAASVKGWMTLEQVSTTFDVPVEEIISQFGMPAGTPASTALKDLESDTFSVTALRDWLATR